MYCMEGNFGGGNLDEFTTKSCLVKQNLVNLFNLLSTKRWTKQILLVHAYLYNYSYLWNTAAVKSFTWCPHALTS